MTADVRIHNFQQMLDVIRDTYKLDMETMECENGRLQKELDSLRTGLVGGHVSPKVENGKMESPKMESSMAWLHPELVTVKRHEGDGDTDPTLPAADGERERQVRELASILLERKMNVDDPAAENHVHPVPLLRSNYTSSRGLRDHIPENDCTESDHHEGGGLDERRGSSAPSFLSDVLERAVTAAFDSTPKNNKAVPAQLQKHRNSQHLIGYRGRIRRLQKIIESPSFEATFGVLILLNAMVIACNAQYSGWGIGHDLGFADSIDSASLWPDAPDFFDALNWLFGFVFFLEIVLKLVAYRLSILHELWHWFDIILVVVWLVEVASAGGGVLLLSPSVLRVLRLLKVLRLVRLVRSIQGFDALYVMTTALRGSLWVLLWTAALLSLVLLLFALLANQVLVETYLTDESHPVEERLEVYLYFGTATRAFLSMFEMTLANWPPVCRLLVENVNEFWVVPSLMHKLTIGFAFVGVINGVFMQETLMVASTDDTIMVRQKERAMRTHTRKMRALFDKLDDSGDNLLDLEEFKAVVDGKDDDEDSRWIRTWLASMELDVSDVNTLYALLDESNDGRLTADELIDGISRLRGPARSIDMAVQMREHRSMQAAVGELRDSMFDLKNELKDLLAGGVLDQRSVELKQRLLHLIPDKAVGKDASSHHLNVTKANLHLEVMLHGAAGAQPQAVGEVKAEIVPLLDV
eukprot:CAMPEP_0178449998 /NCGR_PEP_ID=MMETSP0689_2-20121128/42870_1 /TAXON_ID=160604 /ORGANISM="Amphidinium massartii, Strain CS-259" /LENGTH=695 /DNA_ID=CAMNT_0020075395 /DNA_START=33 /DNA_END=2121 /DNA_ORIENTATION=-